MKELCDWHFKNCAGMGADRYTQDGVADLTRDKLIAFVRAVCASFIFSHSAFVLLCTCRATYTTSLM